MQVSTEERFALTVSLPRTNSRVTKMYSAHSIMIWAVNAFLDAGWQIVSVETLESAIRRDAMERGVW